MFTRKRGARLAAIAASAALVLAACGGEDEEPVAEEPADEETEDEGEEAPEGPTGTVTFAVDQEFESYNNTTADQNGVWNTNVSNGIHLGFWSFNPDLSIKREEEFGTYELTSEDPQTVSYTINDETVWSDGEPIDCDDVLLDWAANSGTMVGEVEQDVLDDAGEPTGETEVVEANIFSPVSTNGYDLTEKPDCEAGDKSFDFVYTDTYADWELLPNDFMPAHIAADQAGMTSEELIEAIKNDDIEALRPVAEFWNEGWLMEQGQLLDPALMPSSGPYILDSWDGGQSITLRANENFYGDPPVAETVVLRLLQQDQQAQALANGEVDVISPQPSPDLLSQLEGLGDQVSILTGPQATWEHVDMQQGAGRVFEDIRVRQAFAKCIPRDLIVSNLIQPINPDAEVLNAREFLTFDENYSAVVEEAFPSDVLDPAGAADIEGSTALLQEAIADGVVEEPVTVRFMHAADNPRREQTAALIQQSCNEAGFDVQPFAEANWGAMLSTATGEYDAVTFAWAGSGVATSGASLYQAEEGNQNWYSYANDTVDQLWDEVLVTLDKDAQNDLRAQIEAELWNDMFNVPMFTFPGITATAADVTGAVHNSAQTQHTHNMEEVGRASS